MEKNEFKEAEPIEENRCITRKVAATVLYELAASSILSDELIEALEEIACKIQMEEIGYHFWGANKEEFSLIFAAIKSEDITVEHEEECERIDAKYSFVPSNFEKVEIDNNICGYEDAEED